MKQYLNYRHTANKGFMIIILRYIATMTNAGSTTGPAGLAIKRLVKGCKTVELKERLKSDFKRHFRKLYSPSSSDIKADGFTESSCARH